MSARHEHNMIQPEMRAARREWFRLAGPSQGRAHKRTTGPPVIQGDDEPGYNTDPRRWLIPRLQS